MPEASIVPVPTQVEPFLAKPLVISVPLQSAVYSYPEKKGGIPTQRPDKKKIIALTFKGNKYKGCGHAPMKLENIIS